MKEITTRVVCSLGSDHRIHLMVDADNGLRILELSFTPEQFGYAISSMSTGEVAAKLWDTYEKSDSRHEHKQEFIKWGEKRVGYRDEDAAKALIAPYEVDGWRGRVADVFNQHLTSNEGVKVSFSRYVKESECT